MTPERWQQITALFHATLDHPGDRDAFLHDATTGDPELRQEVESLLRAHASADTFLDTPAWGVAPELMFDDHEETLAGRTVGPYLVIQEVGRGGTGIVYEAEDTRLGRRVALKALTPADVMDPAHRERLRREARAAAALTHPSIATIFALEDLDGQLFIASELVRGRTLRDELQDGPLPDDRLRPTLLDVAEGLAAAHAMGIVHRDLKPENLMRGPDGRVKILDFGLARAPGTTVSSTRTQLTQPGAAVGTPGYMAPEQWSGGRVDPRTDIFAFGVVAAELATGQHPFGADSAAMLRRMTDLMEGRTVSASGTWHAPDVEQIARRCMRADPAERYASGAELVAALRGTAPADLPAARPDSGRTMWWWQFHQVAVAIVLAAMPALAWAVRTWLERPRGSWLFFASLVMATVSITARMNLVFTARVHPASLRLQRRLVFPRVAILDAALAALMIGTAAALAGEQDGVAGLLMSLGSIIIVSVVFIEPATTRAAGIE